MKTGITLGSDDVGEARRRKDRKLSYVDMETGDRGEARAGGNIEKYIDQMSAGLHPPVPCNGCTICCWHSNVEVDPEKENPKSLPFYITEVGDDGKLKLAKRADGGCIHLGDHGCSIYEHRPISCRGYDCRVWSIFGMSEVMHNTDKATPAWVFDTPTLRGRVLRQAYHMAGMLGTAEVKKQGHYDVQTAIVAGAKFLPDLIKAMTVLGNMSKEETIKYLGITEEEFEQASTEEAHHKMGREIAKMLGIIGENQ